MAILMLLESEKTLAEGAGAIALGRGCSKNRLSRQERCGASIRR